MLNRNIQLLTALLCVFPALGFGDEVTISRGGGKLTLTGNIIAETENENGILFQTQDGKIWPLQPDQILSKSTSEVDVENLRRKALGQKIREELGEGFRIHEAENFVLIYNTEKEYARWVAGLYRRLNRGFCDYWKKRRFKLSKKPAFPLAVLIFKSQLEYLDYMKRDLGIKNPSMLAYYNLESNRVAMYDLTADEFRVAERLDNRRINQVLSNPRAIPMVATIIHEGTHQLMFNYGMQTRFSDTPLWINEGMAMYFETPDLKAERGWRTIGNVNFLRLGPFLEYQQRRPQESLRMMLKTDKGFRNESAADNYCQAWAFNYFLLNNYADEFVDYLKHMAKKPLLIYDTEDQRVEEFEQFFDLNLEQLDREFIQYMRNLNR